MSFFSGSLYQDVARNWKGFCLPYLLSLLALCIIPGVMKIHSDISDYVTNEAPKIARQVPVITIAKGNVSIDKPEPYIIRDEKTGSPLIIIDTTGRTSSLEGSKALVLVKKTELLVKKDENETRRFDLSEIGNMVIDRSLIYNWMDTVEEFFAVVLYPVAVLFSFLYRLAEVLIYAAIGIILTRTLRISLTYRELVRLAAVSITPAMILGALIVAADLRAPYWWIISFWISMGYLFFAIRVNREKSESTAA